MTQKDEFPNNGIIPTILYEIICKFVTMKLWRLSKYNFTENFVKTFPAK